jgi:hypothetical protein
MLVLIYSMSALIFSMSEKSGDRDQEEQVTPVPEVLSRCPVCSGEMRVLRLRCSSCDSELTGSFSLGKLLRLSSEQLRFVEVFVKNEGTIKDVEVELGISYPTVRSRLREVVRALGYEPGEEPPTAPLSPERRRQVLDDLAQKRISADEAARLLRGEPVPS